YDVTAYGQGYEAKFRANLAEYFPGAEVTVIARPSTDLRGHEREFGLANLRFLSIYGGHTRRLTPNDLRIADAGLTDDGLCCLGDVVNPHWLGVISSLFEFLQSGPGLVPVALFPNKLFLSRPARKPFYADAFRRPLPEALERERLELHRSEIDVFGDIWPKVGTALQAIADRAAAVSPAAPAADVSAAARVAMAEAAAAAAEARVVKAEAATRAAMARAERAERKLAKRKSRPWWPFRLRRSELARALVRDLAGAGRTERADGAEVVHLGPATVNEGFDESWYLGAYPDVAAAVARGVFASGLAHYRDHGRAEGRRRSAEDPAARADILGSSPAASDDDRRRKISAVWSDDADQRAERCGWYWLAHPMVVARVNTLISGDPGCDAYGRLKRLFRERGWRLPIERSASLGCGFGNLERDLARRGMVREVDAYDLAEGAVAQARRLAQEAGLGTVRYHVADLDSLSLPEGSLDAVFAHQAVHHVENLEGLYATVHAALRPGGIFHLHEFVGPSRFQWTDAQLAAVNNYLFSLPPHLRRLPDGQPKPPLYRPAVEAMIAADPSEAVRSADILTALDHLFEVIERRELGGTLLHLALGDIAQNFDTAEPKDRRQLERLFDLEDRMLADGLIRSDFAVVTAVPRQTETRRPVSLVDR
ncbi:MAG TPA: class I SAM-dependent methyltransferase, partial [Geminicoccaceae bacterium]|nr:class I SAM-dependent methyltransferase [Geminicoccaceae bacterium]